MPVPEGDAALWVDDDETAGEGRISKNRNILLELMIGS